MLFFQLALQSSPSDDSTPIQSPHTTGDHTNLSARAATELKNSDPSSPLIRLNGEATVTDKLLHQKEVHDRRIDVSRL